jgi:dTDP-4-dehydrorhamnose reductase
LSPTSHNPRSADPNPTASHAPGALLGPLLLIGAGGMLGRQWQALLRREAIAFDAPQRSQLDLANPATLDTAINPRHRVVVNCAAYTQVDKAETEEDAARLINATGVAALARRCAAVGALLVHYSTDYVFNGVSDSPYAIDHRIDPINAYGRTKAEGEAAIRAAGCRHLILRTSWLYAPWGTNFVRTIAKLVRTKESIRVVDDQRGRPTSCATLAESTLALLRAGADGTLHVTDGGECTWHGFAAEIGRQLAAPCRVDPCTTAEFPRPAKRPAYSVLDLGPTEAIIGRLPHWKTQLAAALADLEP